MKEKILNKKTLKQISNSKDYIDYDFDKKIATIPLFYDSDSELIDPHLSRPNVPVISDEVIDYLLRIISEVPKEFSVSFSLNVKEYALYNHKVLLKAFKKIIENSYYVYDEHRHNDSFLSVIFIIVGIVALIAKTIFVNTDYFGMGEIASTVVIETLLDITSWAMIWEGGAILLFTYETDFTFFKKSLRRFNKISFAEEDKILLSVDEDELYKDWTGISGLYRFFSNYILFFNAFLFAFLIIEIAEFWFIDQDFTVGEYILGSVNIAVALLLSISNLCFYKDKGVLRKLALPFAILLAICSIYSIYTFNAMDNIRLLIIYSIIFIGGLINITGILYLRKK